MSDDVPNPYTYILINVTSQTLLPRDYSIKSVAVTGHRSGPSVRQPFAIYLTTIARYSSTSEPLFLHNKLYGSVVVRILLTDHLMIHVII